MTASSREPTLRFASLLAPLLATLLVLFGVLAVSGCSGSGRETDPGEETAADGSSDASADASGDGTEIELEGSAAPPDMFSEPAEEERPESGEVLRTLPVTVYQRAPRERLAITYVDTRIVWFDSPIERARQLVRHVLSGVPGTAGLPPGPKGSTYSEVYLDDRGVLWVDVPGRIAALIDGSDQEQALVACLALTLTRNMKEVRRVGLLVDGESRTTLSGHVDLTRVYSGLEWRKALVIPEKLDGDRSVTGAAP